MTEPSSEQPRADRRGEDASAGSVEIVSDGGSTEGRTAVTDPTKLMRIAIMLREMQEEVRRADPDEGGRQRLNDVQQRAFTEMRSVLSEDLQGELDNLVIGFDDEVPTESEVRIAQAQLIGWLEGLFQGIQAAVFNQQLQARQQLEQMRGRGLPPGAQQAQGEGQRHATGQYL
ncbi:MAG: proteasome activator [Egibacteraceae bacterium]